MKVSLILALLLIVCQYELVHGTSQPYNLVNPTIDLNGFIRDAKPFVCVADFNNVKKEISQMRQVINLLREKDIALTNEVLTLKTQVPVKYEVGRKAAEWQTGHKLASGNGQRNQAYHVSFTNKFTQVPQISVSISRFDIKGDTNQRLNVIAANVTTEGFDIFFITWFDTIVYSAEASWVAIGK